MRNLPLVVLLAAALAACGGRDDEEMTQAEAREKAKEGAFGEQIKALDKAEAAKDALEKDLAERAAEADAAEHHTRHQSPVKREHELARHQVRQASRSGSGPGRYR